MDAWSGWRSYCRPIARLLLCRSRTVDGVVPPLDMVKKISRACTDGVVMVLTDRSPPLCLTASFAMPIIFSSVLEQLFVLQCCLPFPASFSLQVTSAAEKIFETAEEAAQAYDEAAVLMSGRNAKTNFSIPRSATGELAPVPAARYSTRGGVGSSSAAGGSNNLSQILSAKLRKCCKTPSPSLTCLRLDPEKSHIGVWQKRAGARADSSWVMTVELNKEVTAAATSSSEEPALSYGATTTPTSTSTTTDSPPAMDDEERIALQMIEELLGRSGPVDHSHGMLLSGEGSLIICMYKQSLS